MNTAKTKNTMTAELTMGSLMRKSLATVAAGALAIGGALISTGPAQASTESVSNVPLSWSINAESGGGAYAGGCNFLSAGAAGSTGGNRVWTSSDGFYKTSYGDVTITKPNAKGVQTTPTWSNKCQDANGTAVTTNASSSTHNQVNFSNGTGTIDTATNSADIKWTGSFTIVYYGGMTYWTVTDPELTITDGHGELTGTFSGYGTSMDDMTAWEELTPTEGVLANFDNTTVSPSKLGFTATPDYVGVDTGQTAATTVNASYWGSFPQDWVDFNKLTGQSSYWYTSGSIFDARKVASDITIGKQLTFGASATPTISGTKAVGKTLTAKTGTWTPTPSFAYQWYGDGKAIKGATKSTYKVASTYAGKKVYVKVTATKSGYVTTSKNSASSTIALQTFSKSATPKITGTKKVGKTLKVKVGTWSPKPKYSYQWYANGKAIKGATKSSYKLKKAQKSKKITVKVTGKKTGYKTVAKTSKKTSKVKK